MLAPSLLAWFEPDELDDCPECGQHAALVLPATATRICFACGSIAFPAGITSVAAVQGRSARLDEELAQHAASRRVAEAKQHGVDLTYRSGDTHHLS